MPTVLTVQYCTLLLLQNELDIIKKGNEANFSQSLPSLAWAGRAAARSVAQPPRAASSELNATHG